MSAPLEPCIYWTLTRQQPAGSVFPTLDWLSPAERARLEGMKFPARRNDWLAGRWAAKHLLQKVHTHAACVALDAIEIANDSRGAPFISVEGEPWPGMLSISHRAGTILCAVASGPIDGLGVDVERVEPRSQELVDDFFTEREAEAISICDEARREVWIPLIWSAKEAILKALGAGLRIDTREVELFPTLNSSPSHAPGWQVWWGCCSRLEDGVAQVLWQRQGEDVLTLVVLAPREADLPALYQIELDE